MVRGRAATRLQDAWKSIGVVCEGERSESDWMASGECSWAMLSFGVAGGYLGYGGDGFGLILFGR